MRSVLRYLKQFTFSQEGARKNNIFRTEIRLSASRYVVGGIPRASKIQIGISGSIIAVEGRPAEY